MRNSLPLIVVAVILINCTGPAPSNTSSLESRVDSLVKRHLDSAKFAGVAIAVVKGNERLLYKGYGKADLAFQVPMPVEASFEIGSVTKQFTGAAILQLVEAGKLKLDDEATQYIKFDTKGKKVTIRQLLSHTSGIKGYTELPFFRQLKVFKFKRDTLLRLVEKEPFDFEPGEALIYNNTGFFMLGLIIEKVSGMTYEEYVQKNLFEKAGMTHSYYCSEQKVVQNKAYGYDGSKEGLHKAAYIDHNWPYAAGSLCSTVEDLVLWNQALHHGKILGEQAYQEMITPVKLNDGTATRYAKGIAALQVNEVKVIRHGGGINGFLSENTYYPGSDLSVVVLMNSTGPVGPDDIADEIGSILDLVQPEEPLAFDGDLDQLIGEYTGRGRGRDVVVKIEKSGTTLTASTNDGKPKTLTFTRQGWADHVTYYMFRGEGRLDVDSGGGYLRLVRK